MILRPYQDDAVTGLRVALRGRILEQIPDELGNLYERERRVRSALLQLATGGGKTPIVSKITHSAWNKEVVIWFVVPRNELLTQASEHFVRWNIAHGLIAAGKEESRAYRVHVVSKDTLLRRLERIKNWPDLIIFDEAHLYIRAQLLIIGAAPSTTMVIGVTATPERLDGRGLWSGAGGPYDTIYYGPSIPWLTEHDYLSPLRYFAPPIEGLENVRRSGTEYNIDDLAALLEKRKVYGDVVGYYEKYGTVEHTAISAPGAPTARTHENYHKGKPALIFTRSVKEAYEMAERFTQAGYLFFCIEGKMPTARRRELINAHKAGKIDGLTNCELATYGLDIPRVEYGASTRPTLSRALYMQKVGRCIRPFVDRDTGYEKEEAYFFDHVNLVKEHQEPDFPDVPLFYLDELTWNFEGRKKRKRLKRSAGPSLRLCPFNDYCYCDDPGCARGCKRETDDQRNKRLGLETVDVELQERTHKKAKLNEYPPEERREMQDRIGRATDEFFDVEDGEIAPGPVGELVRIADELGRYPMWVYWHLVRAEEARNDRKRYTVNVPLLQEIARQKGYKPGWAWFKKKQIHEGITEGENTEEHEEELFA